MIFRMEMLLPTGARYRLVRALPGIVMLAAATADFLTPRQDRYGALLYVVPGLAAVSWGVWGTLGFGAVAVLALTALEVHRGVPLGTAAVAGAVLVGAISLVAAWTSSVRLDRERELQHVQEVADVAQRALQHPLPEHLGCVDLHLLYETSVAGAHMGGDFYKALHVAGGVRLMIGDVQGKGLGAVECAAVLLGSFRESAYVEPDLPSIARKLETSMRHHALRVGIDDADRFATVLLAEVPDGLPVMRLLSCGHPPPVHQDRAATRCLAFRRPSPPVHLPVPVEEEHVVEEVPFRVGDRVLMYTDGVSETRNASGEFYPLADRMTEWADVADGDLLVLLGEDLHRYSAHGPDDDTAAVLVSRTAVTPSAG
ncbi:membrane protein [Streptomyces subrutilus]|uniref:Membrane protein n=2 Tax=Streptomyces subrutilus TaxID=36818 RepID=A0A5P2URZ7_9ACTN|nr:serine/threonine-protein phosphatase [Streptomyces subrutilus]GGZ89094.1 membrane protein [Streptomyces subrutilus]